jgi:hypothetical protein
MNMKIIGCLLVIGILCFYAPVFSMDQCPEENHMGKVKIDCGYSFHCPMIVNNSILGTYRFPFSGRLVPTKPFLVVDELIRVIFRPPKVLRFSAFRDKGKAII